MCMVFTLHGQNLLWLIKEFDYKGVPIDIVKELGRGVLEVRNSEERSDERGI